MDNRTYPNINMEKTGILLKEKIAEQGYTVKDIQKYLKLSCPQPIYRWFKGQMLPSLDHLLMLSRILKVHMEDLLVLEADELKQETAGNPQGISGYMIEKMEEKRLDIIMLWKDMRNRLLIYWQKLNNVDV